MTCWCWASSLTVKRQHSWRKLRTWINGFRKNCLHQNFSKTKILVVDFSRGPAPLSALMGLQWKVWGTFNYRDVHISDKIWYGCCMYKSRKAGQLGKVWGLSSDPEDFHSGAVEGVSTQNITSWFGNSCVQDIKGLLGVIRAAERCTRSALPSQQHIYTRWRRTRATRIIRDSSDRSTCLFQLLKSGKCCRSVMAENGNTHEQLLSLGDKTP